MVDGLDDRIKANRIDSGVSAAHQTLDTATPEAPKSLAPRNDNAAGNRACRGCGRTTELANAFCIYCGEANPAPPSPYASLANGGPSRTATLRQEETIVEVVSRVATELDRGRSPAQIADQLSIGATTPRAEIAQFVWAVQARLAEKHKKHMIYGSLWFLGGGIVTLVTYGVASESGIFVVFWGAMLWGAIDFVRGLAGWWKYHG